MLRYVLRRLAFAAVLVVTVSSSALLLTRLAPGDMATGLGPFAPPEEVAAVRARFGLDQPVAQQWLSWLGAAATFDFGESFLYNRPVSGLLRTAAANTALLAVVALAVATLVGIPLGIVSGSRRGWVASLVRGVSLVVLSVPSLVISLLLVFVAARTGWLPSGGMTSAAGAAASWPVWARDVALHLPVPVLALALPVAATFERLQAQAIAEASGELFVVSAVARGLGEWRVVRHAWRASLRPVCAVYGLAVGTLLSGSFIVEFVTAWPGLGRLTYDALRARDIYLVAGCAAMGGLFLAAGTLLGDVLLALADPRTRERH
ncbi:MAG: ABC transporter permease [Vicinamibacterales bacterium]